MAAKTISLLLERRAPDVRIRQEARPSQVRGPQCACHQDELEFCVIEHGLEHVGDVELDRGQNDTRR